MKVQKKSERKLQENLGQELHKLGICLLFQREQI